MSNLCKNCHNIAETYLDWFKTYPVCFKCQARYDIAFFNDAREREEKFKREYVKATLGEEYLFILKETLWQKIKRLLRSWICAER